MPEYQRVPWNVAVCALPIPSIRKTLLSGDQRVITYTRFFFYRVYTERFNYSFYAKKSVGNLCYERYFNKFR